MRYVEQFGRFWYDFIVGDDWRVAIGVVASIGLTALLVELDVNAWWLMVVAVFGTLAYSVGRVAK